MIKMLNIFRYVIFLMLIVVFFNVGPRIEKTFFPVISKFEIPVEAITKLTNGGVEFSGVLVKTRGQCEPVPGSLTVFSDEFVSNVQTPAKEVKIQIESSNRWFTRPEGAQFFGPWTLTPPVPPLGPSLIIRMQHQCHPFWKTESVLYVGLTSDFFTQDQIVGGEPPWTHGETNVEK